MNKLISILQLFQNGSVSGANMTLDNHVSITYDGKNVSIEGSIDDILHLLDKSLPKPSTCPTADLEIRDALKIQGFVRPSEPLQGSSDQKSLPKPKQSATTSKKTPVRWQVTCLSPEDFLSMDTENPHPSFLTSGGLRTDGLYLLSSAPNPKQLFTITEYSRQLGIGDSAIRYFVAQKCVKYFWNKAFYLDIIEVDSILRRNKRVDSAKLEEMVKSATGYEVPQISGFYPYASPDNPWIMMVDDIANVIGIGADSLRTYLAHCMNASCPRMVDIRQVLEYRERDEKKMLMSGSRGEIPRGNDNLKRCIDEISDYCKRYGIDARVSLNA